MRKLWSLIAVCVLLTGCAVPGDTEDANYPNRPIEMIIAYEAGGVTDSIAQAFSRVISDHMPGDQPVVVRNIPGGAGVVGTTKAWQARPDGYTISMVPPGPLSVQPLYGNAPYQPEEFRAIIRLASNPIVFAVRSDAPWDTFEEWLEWTKKNPGEFSYASGATGAPSQLALEQLVLAENLRTSYVPFQSTGEAYAALLGGHVDGVSVSSQQVKAGLAAGEVKILANLGTDRDIDYLHGVPSLTELGYDMAIDAYFGIVASADIPDDRVTVLHDAFQATLNDPDVNRILKNTGVLPDYAPATTFQQQIMDDFAVYRETLTALQLIHP
ncbi:tripartite tricarboxylate transporter substrate binding protein [Saccharomonospora sp. NPDC046836]|uniref:Bug family tripartite tricarboxylate transporter substrate binding protein n=1 Tax=Saccharomonospora sp. NPDC046836 TaxID=3156921 RepID=UPI00340284A7